ncbi:T9SS type A sorting domain-containing protein [Flavobacterium sp.]|uniref:T9SS type A sorting domain-containing protein n=1 Tax=Flavobacterium sp. TaxID=239 RepID=UPI0040470C85
MKKNHKILILLVFIFNFSLKNYAQIAATYNSNTSGTLSGVPFAVTNINAIQNAVVNLSYGPYAAAPLPSAPMFQHSSTDNLVITFDNPIPNLRVYVYWRAGVYSFDQPFTILSGNDIQNTSGNNIVVSSIGQGIIEFTNPVTTLNLSVSSAAIGYNGTTFGLAQYLDLTPPSVTSVTVPTNTTYTFGQNLDFIVNFDEAVNVDTGSGTPLLELKIGSTTRQAVYQSGSGTNTLLFSYTTQCNDLDSDGITVEALAANGSTMRDAAANNANLTLNNIESTANVFVNTLPTLTFTAPADLCFDVGLQVGLGGGSSTGGIYSGAGVTDDGNGATYSLNPAVAGVGVHTITYTFTNTNGCTNSISDDVEIFAIDNPSFSYDATSYCVNASDPIATITGVTGGTFTSSTGLSINASNGTIDASASTPGTYTVTYTTAGTCPNSSSVAITITALEDASFNYDATSYCVNASDPIATIIGVTGGTFSSSTGLSINASNGTIDASASTPGTYTVTYTTAGTCPNSSSVAITITALEDASFNYDATSYCLNATDPIATITGVTGGTFTSSTGLSINTSNGTIDASASTPGTYSVIYTTAGTCPNSSSVAITITALEDASFNYDATSYCVNASDPIATIIGVTGGTFSSSTGLSINASNGTIDASASTPGTYTVTYTTAGTCPNSSSVAITIKALPTVTFTAPADLCFNVGVQNGLGGGTTTGGIYSGAGVTDDGNGATYSFDPVIAGVGVHTITYTLTDDNLCTNSASDTVEVFGAIDNTISEVTTGILTANEAGATYQWYQCTNSLITGATSQDYEPTALGDYKVEITVGSCTVESTCYTLTALDASSFENKSTFMMYPNPTNGLLNIDSNFDGDFSIANQLGQTVKLFKVNSNLENSINVENLADGIYFIKGSNGTQIVSQRLIIKK